MGIRISRDQLQSKLEEGVGLAESGDELPEEWLRRTERIAACPSQTYVAALGVALLAKATDPRVDVLTVKSGVAPTAYSMRGVAGVLAERASHYGYHLGVTGPEPLNNQPWFGGTRIDRFTRVRADVRPFQRDMVRYLRDLNPLNEDEATLALAAFLRLRLQYAKDKAERATIFVAEREWHFDAVVDLTTGFVSEDPEGGRRGQALVAGLLDCVYDEVKLAAINDPRALDVATVVDGQLDLAIEVKQKPVAEGTALHLAEEARAAGADKALLVAIATDQSPLDRESARLQAAERFEVLLGIVESVPELFAYVTLWSGCPVRDIAAEFPAAYARRMEEHGVSDEARSYWADLVAGLDTKSS